MGISQGQDKYWLDHMAKKQDTNSPFTLTFLFFFTLKSLEICMGIGGSARLHVSQLHGIGQMCSHIAAETRCRTAALSPKRN